MWSPIVLTPPLVAAGIGGVFSRGGRRPPCPSRPGSTRRRAARGVLPRPRGGPQARRLAAVAYNLPMGRRSPRPARGHGRRDGPARRGAAPGGVMSRDADSTGAATTCPSSAPAGTAAPALAAPPATGDHPADDRPLPGLRRARRRDTWDDATRKVVFARLEPPGPLRFFTAAEEPTLRAFCDTVMAQDARAARPGRRGRRRQARRRPARRLPVRGTCRTTATPGGWSLRGLDHTARQGYARGFAACTGEQRGNIVERVRRRTRSSADRGTS